MEPLNVNYEIPQGKIFKISCLIFYSLTFGEAVTSDDLWSWKTRGFSTLMLSIHIIIVRSIKVEFDEKLCFFRFSSLDPLVILCDLSPPPKIILVLNIWYPLAKYETLQVRIWEKTCLKAVYKVFVAALLLPQMNFDLHQKRWSS